jgi:hypothetical protein
LIGVLWVLMLVFGVLIQLVAANGNGTSVMRQLYSSQGWRLRGRSSAGLMLARLTGLAPDHLVRFDRLTWGCCLSLENRKKQTETIDESAAEQPADSAFKSEGFVLLLILVGADGALS